MCCAVAPLLLAAAMAPQAVGRTIALQDIRTCCAASLATVVAQAQSTPGAASAPDQAEPASDASDGAGLGRAAEGEFLLLSEPTDPAAFEQEGADLTPEEERAAISVGWP